MHELSVLLTAASNSVADELPNFGAGVHDSLGLKTFSFARANVFQSSGCSSRLFDQASGHMSSHSCHASPLCPRV